MYGLLLDSIQKFLREKYGEHYWIVIRRRANLKNHWFMTHEVYSDTVMTDLIDAAANTLGEDRKYVMQLFGEYFVKNIGRYGYARLLRVLGRDMRDFLNGLDDLHEYLRFSYPKIKPPSFFCESETPGGMVMHYRTKRRGYLPYVMGQLIALGKVYKKSLVIEILNESVTNEGSHFVLNVKFDNYELMKQRRPSISNTDIEINGSNFLSIFPFCIMFNQDLKILIVGDKMSEVLPGLLGQKLNETFELTRPMVDSCCWNSICMHRNCIFEMVSINQVISPNMPLMSSTQMSGSGNNTPVNEESDGMPYLKLKGQMLLLHAGEDSNKIIFLCSPVLSSLEELFHTGIFINDMSMHDSTRDFVLAGSQQHPELSLALDQEQIRTKQLEVSIQKTDELLYQMIPKPIADKLRDGETALNTCQVWPSVSILFSDIVSFTAMCGRLRPMEVVCVLNTMYVSFDHLCEKYHVYKVQTIGDGYMALSGAPIETPHHAEYITEFAFASIEAMSKIHDPSTQESLQIRVGIHSGTVVGGVVGSSILRYDVFGDTVNTAARMEATGMPMKIHISQTTAELLDGTGFVTEKRLEEIAVKGKGLMQTYWVLEKKQAETGEILDLNPLQRKKLMPKHRSVAACDVADIATTRRQRLISEPVIKYEPRPSDGAKTMEGSLRRRSSSPILKRMNPSKWPAMEDCEKGSENNASNIEFPQFQSVVFPLPTDDEVSDNLKDFACRNVKSVKNLASMAEDHAQQARKMAAMAKHLSTLADRGPNLKDLEESLEESHDAPAMPPLGCPVHSSSSLSPPISHSSHSIGTSVDCDSDNVNQTEPNCIIL